MSAVYTKLRSGDWGLEVSGEVGEGEVVAVRMQDGSLAYETVKRIICETSRYTLCTIAEPRECGNFSEVEFREGRCGDRYANPVY
jgi:hypothetical protein